MDKQRAKQIIVELVRQNGGTFTNKTNLYKAFYHAHLEYAKTTGKLLSDWPIVRMPNGPGIESFDALLMGELMVEGKMLVEDADRAPCEGVRFTLLDGGLPTDLDPQAIAAAAYGASMVRGKTAAQVSKESHQRAWDRAADGREMNIYLDLASPQQVEANRPRLEKMAAAFRKAVS
jgi:hypothetical protein